MKLAGKTDVGSVRPENQDDYRAGELNSDAAWGLVCDGMGGARGGREASVSACDVIEHSFHEQYAQCLPGDEEKFLKRALINANRFVFQKASREEELAGMGTTAVCALVRGGNAFICHAGDSRAYLVRDGKLTQLTHDHSYVQELVDCGTITEEEADQRLRLMLVDFEKMVDDVLDASPLVHTQSQYDAMISFTFNLGPQWINPKYNIYQYFVYGGYTEMEFVNTMGRWLSSSSEVVDGLAKRRIDEADMYLNGVYRLGSTAYVRVVFNAMGGEAEEDYVYYKTGRSLGMLPNAYRSGHYFVGWYDRALSGGTCYTPETTAPARGNITLYARWEATGLPYQDISHDAWYFEAVSEATDRGLFQGTSETTFEPESTMNRAMLATVIYRMAGSPAGAAKAPFTDVAAADWFADAVAWAYENGVVKGMSATSFAPLQEITREQLAVMLLRYADLCGYDTSARASLKDFADAAKVSDYAADAMQWAVANGILNGTDGKRLDPAGSATRAQCAAMLVRFLDKFEAPAA